MHAENPRQYMPWAEIKVGDTVIAMFNRATQEVRRCEVLSKQGLRYRLHAIPSGFEFSAQRSDIRRDLGVPRQEGQ